MPRPKSELTNLRPRNISARLTEDQHIMLLKLGGSRWIRSLLQAEVNKQRKAGNVP